MAKHKVKLGRDHGRHKAGSVIEVSEHTLKTFRDRMEPVGAAQAAAPPSAFASPQAESLAQENSVTVEQLRERGKPSGDGGYTKPDVQAFIDARQEAAEKAEEERRAVIFGAKADELGKPVEELTDEERAAALAEFDEPGE